MSIVIIPFLFPLPSRKDAPPKTKTFRRMKETDGIYDLITNFIDANGYSSSTVYGFIAGLLLSSGFLLNMLANGLKEAKKTFVNPVSLTVYGVIIALFFSILPVFFNKTFFEGMWLPEFSLPLLGTLHIGTPLFFDVGVFMAVIGFTVSVIFDLEKAE